jgi:hypothetical protein
MVSMTPVFRPFRAVFLDMFPGLNPRAESCSPFGTKRERSAKPTPHHAYRSSTRTSEPEDEHEDDPTRLRQILTPMLGN